ncbi:hypothetical protein ACWCQW_10325 [Streptomyces mirabilis]
MSADQWTPGERLAAIVAQEINDAPAEELIKAATDDVLREWAAKVREVGAAKGWSVWAAAFIDPDVSFVDTGMPSTETIVAELRRLDRVALFREAADAVDSGKAGFPDEVRSGASWAARMLRRRADEVEQEKDTSGGSQPSAGESTPALGDLLRYAEAFEIPRPGNTVPLLLERSYAGGDRWSIGDREGRRWDLEQGFVYERQNLDERTRTDTRFPLAEAWPLALRIAAGEAGP